MTHIRPLELRLPDVAPSSSVEAPGQGSFEGVLGKALDGLESLQGGADQEAGKLALGAGNLHETALAMEKADVSMRLAVKVRNKAVEAYQEVMRMNV